MSDNDQVAVLDVYPWHRLYMQKYEYMYKLKRQDGRCGDVCNTVVREHSADPSVSDSNPACDS